MLQNLTKGKMVEWVVLLVALVALGLSIAAVAKPCSSNFANVCKTVYAMSGGYDSCGAQGYAGKSCDPNEQFSCGSSPVCKCGGDGGSGSPGLVPGGECQDIGDKNSCNQNRHCVFWNGQCGAKGEVCEKGADCGNPAPGTDTCQIGTCNGGVCKKMLDDTYSCQSTSSGGSPHPSEYPCCHKDFICRYNEQCEEHQCGLCDTKEQGLPGTCTGAPNSKKPIDPKCNSGKNSKSGGKKGLIGGGGSLPPGLGNIGGGSGSTYDPTGSGNGDGGSFPPPGIGGGGTPSPPSSPSPSRSPSPSPSPGGGGKKSSNLPLILGGSVGAVILLVLVYLVMTKRLKL